LKRLQAGVGPVGFGDGASAGHTTADMMRRDLSDLWLQGAMENGDFKAAASPHPVSAATVGAVAERK